MLGGINYADYAVNGGNRLWVEESWCCSRVCMRGDWRKRRRVGTRREGEEQTTGQVAGRCAKKVETRGLEEGADGKSDGLVKSW